MEVPLDSSGSSYLRWGEQHYVYARDVPRWYQIASNYLWVGACSVLGTLVRLALLAVPEPLGLLSTLYPNVIGCFVLGACSRRWVATNAPAAYVGATTGFCGSLTTFSGWAIATAQLIARNHVGRAALSVLLPLGGCCCAFKLGLVVGEFFDAETKDADLEPTQAMLPCYHSFKLRVGALALVVALGAVVAVAAAGPTWARAPAAAAALAPPGASIRYFCSSRNRRCAMPYFTLLANASATFLAGSCVLLLAKYDGAVAQLTQALLDGFCGGLSTVATLVSEFHHLRAARESQRRGYAYVALTFLAGQALALPFVASVPALP